MENYRHLLRSYIDRRAKGDRRFSLRNLSLKAGISHALLSQVLREKRNLSKDTASRLAAALKLNRKEKAHFLSLVEYAGHSSSKYKESILKDIEMTRAYESVRDLDHPSFRLIADWYHSAIIEMTNVIKIKPDDEVSLAKCLSISQADAQKALQRLQDLKILELGRQGYLQKTADVMNMPTTVPSASIREHHKQMIHKALVAIDNQTMQERYITDMTFSIEKSHLGEAYELIEDFKTRMGRLMTEAPNKNSVYQMNIQLFNLCQLKEGQKI